MIIFIGPNNSSLSILYQTVMNFAQNFAARESLGEKVLTTFPPTSDYIATLNRNGLFFLTMLMQIFVVKAISSHGHSIVS